MNQDQRHRLFFALLPGPGVVERIALAADALAQALQPAGNRIAPASYHLTLRFLGEDSRLHGPLVESAMAAARRVRFAPFELVLDRAFSFPGARPPWVLGCAETAGPLHRLRGLLDAALAEEGMPPASGSAFVPHVTLLRHASIELPMRAIEPISWPIPDFALIHSQPGEERRYVELGRWPLQT